MEFLRRLRSGQSHYDILIYSDTVYPEVEKLFISNQRKKSSLTQITKLYFPSVLAHFKNRFLNRNTAIFQMSLTGFLWNSSKMSVSKEDTLEKIFAKANSQTNAMIDDQVEAQRLLNTALGKPESKSNTFPTVKVAKKLFGDAKILFSNEITAIAKSDDFGLAYTWSGDALNVIDRLQNSTRLKFMVHPKLSYGSLDLISILSEKSGPVCAAKKISSKKFLASISYKTFYFSPFGPLLNVPNDSYRDLSRKFFSDIKQLQWVSSNNPESSDELKNDWMQFKLELGQTK